jgi:ABC-type sugar transport system ATPase subunit
LQTVGLLDAADRALGGFSKGMRQRAKVAAALVSEPEVLLLDEPLSNLDAKLRQQMRVDLRKLQRDLGLTVIYVTHDQVEAMTMADQVVVMRDGRVDQVDPPRTLFQRPARTSVARFIGAPPMNLIEARVEKDEITIDGTGVRIPAPPGPADLPSPVMIGLRPEDVVIDGGSQRIDGSLTTLELLGADQLARFDIGDSEPLVARLHANVLLEEGHQYNLGFELKDLHIFDAESGMRLPGWDGANAPTATQPSETKG